GGNPEARVEQDLAPRLVAEIDVLAAHRRRPRRQVDGGGAGRPLTALDEKPEHAVHVRQRLLDVAVDAAEEVERYVELYEEPVHEHEVADGQRPVRHSLRGQDHEQRHGPGDDQALADVQYAEGRL